MPEILKDLNEADYHSQTNSNTPLFSYSVAKNLLHDSPYHAHMYHPLLGGQKIAPTKAMDKGSIIHSLLLGGGQEIVVIIADNFRTKAAQEERDMAYDEDKIPILDKEMTAINESIETIKKNIRELAPYFFEPCEFELSVRWEMDNSVKCQSRFDWIQLSTGKIIELKTANDANPQKLDRKILDFGYDIQGAMYLQAANKVWPEMAGRFTWEFIFVEPEPPYMVSVIETDSSMTWLGEHKLQRAADKWKRCLESGVFPGYGRQTVSAPGWAVSREEEE